MLGPRQEPITRQDIRIHTQRSASSEIGKPSERVAGLGREYLDLFDGKFEITGREHKNNVQVQHLVDQLYYRLTQAHIDDQNEQTTYQG